MNEIIFETKTFIVEIPAKPFISRGDGGHVRVMSKIHLKDRTELTSEQRQEYITLTSAVGKSLELTMNERGIEIGNINWQEMGNWSVHKPEGITLHTHIFGRAKKAEVQTYGEAVKLPFRDSGFYDNFNRLDDKDTILLKAHIEKLFQEYS